MSDDLAHLPGCRHCASVPPLQRLIWEEPFVKIVAESGTKSSQMMQIVTAANLQDLSKHQISYILCYL